MYNTFELDTTWKKLKGKVKRQFRAQKSNVKANVKAQAQAFDWISETLISAGVVIKMNSSKDITNS